MRAALAERALRWIAGLLARTWRLDVQGQEHLDAARDAGVPVVYAVWHDLALAPLWHRRGHGITLLVSGHRDGRRLAHAARRWGYRIASGSSTRGGTRGLRRAVRALREGGDAAFTPDGPRGPARQVKTGAVAAAQLGGALIVPVAASAAPAWRARSWDAFLLPRPFARVRIVYGRPFAVPAGREERLRGRERLESELRRVEEEALCAS